MTMSPVASRLLLDAEVASDLMTPNPVSIRADAPLEDALALLTARGLSGAAVIDAVGRVAGAVSQTDILLSDRSESRPRHVISDFFQPAGAGPHAKPLVGRWRPPADGAVRTVAEIMTPTVFAVAPGAPAAHVVCELLTHQIHRMFVVDLAGTLVGVISQADVLRRLRR